MLIPALLGDLGQLPHLSAPQFLHGGDLRLPLEGHCQGRPDEGRPGP